MHGTGRSQRGQRHGPAALLLFLLALSLAATAASALADVHGRILDRKSQAPVPEALLKLTALSDTTETHILLTHDDGTFTIADLGPRAYRLDASRIGYAAFRTTIVVTGASQDLGTLFLSAKPLRMGEVLVEGQAPPAQQKADTTEFSARAFKIRPDADVSDLVEKMPGLTIQNNTVKSNGETVQQVLVDGKPFFGQDPMIALHNLPAEVIDRIQVFDKLSDQAEFTGFDDGQSIKTMNLILRPEKRNSDFGKLYGGSGDAGRYLTGGSVNYLAGDQRLSLIGLSDNVNQQNFSAQDLLGVLSTGSQGRGGAFGGGPNGFRAGGGGGGGGRGGRGGFGGGGGPRPGGGFGGGPGGSGNFLVGQQDGITSTSSVGANYSGNWGKNLVVNQSYFFNATDNRNVQSLNRLYPVPQDSVALYDQNTTSRNKNYNNRYDARIEDTVNESNSVIDQVRLYFQNNNASSDLSGANLALAGAPLSQATNVTDGSTSGENLSDDLLYRHRFAARGRTVSADLRAEYDGKDGSSTLHSLDSFAGTGAANDTLDQRSDLSSTTSSVSGRLAYTEPLGETSLMMFTYSPRVSNSHSGNGAFLLDPVTQAYTRPDTALSNTFASLSTAQNVGIGVMNRQPGRNLMANVSYQASTLSERQSFPATSSVHKSFRDVLPFAMLNWNIPGQRNLRISYFSRTQVPTISQVQNVVDTSNPLSLTSGNPELRESYVQTALCRYSTTNPNTGRSIFLLLSAQHVDNYIGNATVTASRDSTLAGGTPLKAGTQYIYPVNLSGYWNLNSFLTYSHPVGLLKSVVNLNSGVTYTRTPGRINTSDNLASAVVLSQGAVLSSNVSENVDFTLSYTGSYNIAHNSLPSAQDSDYYNHVASLKLNLIVWRGIEVRNELSNTLYSGLGSGYDSDIVLWNAYFGKKLLANDSAEIKLTASDVLNQNTSVSRTVSGTYIQDTQNLTLRPYVMLSFTYTVK